MATFGGEKKGRQVSLDIYLKMVLNFSHIKMGVGQGDCTIQSNSPSSHVANKHLKSDYSEMCCSIKHTSDF